ncbi:MAG: hypothetical protein ACJAR2_000608 [Ilumatobacter sp.]|jgi:hypothetical protein
MRPTRLRQRTSEGLTRQTSPTSPHDIGRPSRHILVLKRSGPLGVGPADPEKSQTRVARHGAAGSSSGVHDMEQVGARYLPIHTAAQQGALAAPGVPWRRAESVPGNDFPRRVQFPNWLALSPPFACARNTLLPGQSDTLGTIPVRPLSDHHRCRTSPTPRVHQNEGHESERAS